MTPELEEYITRHIDAEPEHLHRLQRHIYLRLINPRMSSGHLQGRLLKMLVRMIRPRRILELGTYGGYAAQCLAEGLSGDAFIDTIEIFDELEDFISEHLAESPVGDRVRVHFGDAAEVLRRPGMTGYDLVFIDANKRSYCDYYEMVFPLVRDGGFIIADNTLWDGHVVEEAYRHDAQTAALLRFNDMVAADERVEKVILPVRDGLTLIYKLPASTESADKALKR